MHGSFGHDHGHSHGDEDNKPKTPDSERSLRDLTMEYNDHAGDRMLTAFMMAVGTLAAALIIGNAEFHNWALSKNHSEVINKLSVQCADDWKTNVLNVDRRKLGACVHKKMENNEEANHAPTYATSIMWGGFMGMFGWSFYKQTKRKNELAEHIKSKEKAAVLEKPPVPA